MTPAEEQSKAIELVISNLTLTLEEAMMRLEAYRNVIARNASHLDLQVHAEESALQASPMHQKYTALRQQAIQAVRDSNPTVLVESIGDMRGVARLSLDYVRPAGFQTAVKS